MGDKTGIQWTDATWNCVTGCDKVSPGCKNCYAERIFPRAYSNCVICRHSHLGAEPTGFTEPVGDGLGLADSHGGDPAEWPAELRVREFLEVGRREP